ncbi:MAG: hypothetical protein A3I09_03815 [Deltaproteobacteria bacterium RIFCSPLOWO2_02_FULL_47_10]|nr:MAG: hypothetical protein A3I09_03815 [Deltaproteobacteria bacterium RIFCSPLOWO2_02_FULL_47_10]
MPFSIDNIYSKYIRGREAYITLGTALLGGIVYLTIRELRDAATCKDFVRKYCGGNLPDRDVSRLCADNGLRQIIYKHLKFSSFIQSDGSHRAAEAYFSSDLAEKCREILEPANIPRFQTEGDALRFDRERNEAPFYRFYPATWGEWKNVATVPAMALIVGALSVLAPALVSKPSFSSPSYGLPIGGGFYNHSSKELQTL